MHIKTSKDIMLYFESKVNDNSKTIVLELLESNILEIGYKSFIDLAQIYFYKMLTPIKISDDTLHLTFQKLNQSNSFHKSDNTSDEKYGVESEFFAIEKGSKFSFLYHYRQALNLVKLKTKSKILNLGINKGDEFKIIKDILDSENFNSKKLVGIDYSQTAIKYANESFNDTNISFISHDINNLDNLNLGKFDLIITIGTLQSVNIDFKKTFMNLIQNYLEINGAIVMGFPNCRWIDGEMVYGATVPNYNFSEMSRVIKDIYFCKKYLQQKKYRVTITGKDYLFLVATKFGID
ncbi:MAG: methyltransferase domain-containing protein [Campylobacterota bacterium]|nr:methyltransferase domain-containing protein [Campylobacterota bacterium]